VRGGTGWRKRSETDIWVYCAELVRFCFEHFPAHRPALDAGPINVTHYVYILANKPKGAIYVGTARELRERIEQHKAGKGSTHTAKYNIQTLIYFEQFGTAVEAVHREKLIKKWRREWKDELIEKVNPEWRDISADIPY
jgi:putative endonuclease